MYQATVCTHPVILSAALKNINLQKVTEMKKIITYFIATITLVVFATEKFSAQERMFLVFKGGKPVYTKNISQIDSLQIEDVMLSQTATVNSSLSVGHLTFLTYNLGAVQDMTAGQQIVYTPTDNTDATVYGDLYQWGRKTDGHEKRTSDTTSVLATSTNPGHDKFIVGVYANGSTILGNGDWLASPNPSLWGVTKTANDPCPEGFRIPTLAEFASIHGDNSGNTWTWTGNGYKISPDGGITYPLFLPVTGQRRYDSGDIVNLGDYPHGVYWTSNIYTSNLMGKAMNFYNFGNNNTIYTGDTNTIEFRAEGAAVRCIAIY